MPQIYLRNETGLHLNTLSARGTSWTYPFSPQSFGPDQTDPNLVATIDEAETSSEKWGWIEIGLNSQQPTLQLYVWLRKVQTDDYAVQYLGDDENDKTIAQTSVELDASSNIIFTIRNTVDSWMFRIPEEQMLHQITIPGTHDSGTHSLSAISKCQSMTIRDQLMAGIRYFDIRLNAFNLDVVHGGGRIIGITEYNLKDVANLFRQFLDGKPNIPTENETIILQLKIDRGTESAKFHTKVRTVLENALNDSARTRLHAEPIRLTKDGTRFDTIPTLKDLRGKVVLLCRYVDENQEADDAGTPVQYFASGRKYNEWSANPHNKTWLEVFDAESFEWPENGHNMEHFNNQLIDYRNRHGLSLVIQDTYSITDLGSDFDKRIAGKVALVKQYMEAARLGNSPDSWFLNFASCTETLCNPEDYSAKINPEIKEYFKNPPAVDPGCGFGTILLDFVDAELAASIIASNF